MEEEMIKNIKEQHVNSYKNALLETILNNSNVLADDLISLFQKPPLDSMDSIKNKFLECAKKNKIVLDMNKFDTLLEQYRAELIKCCDKIKNKRIKYLSDKVNKFDFDESENIMVFYKKDYISLNKELKKLLKEQMIFSLEHILVPNIASVFLGDVTSEVRDKMVLDISKYVKGNYQKQILENYDIKILVKDTILANSVKEQSERYLFTINNSRLLNLEN